MGIQGFTKFIEDRAELYFENYELRDCTLIIDGHSISCQLYNWKHWQFDARSVNSYGGDYDKYAYIVENFFCMLKKVRVKPIVVFDGGFEQRKLPTILNRMQDKINIADKLNPDVESKQPNKLVFPLFLRETFKDVLRNMDIQMVMCKYEGDSDIASIAKIMNCPVLTFDSDYFLFGVQYIPFKSLDSRVQAIENWRTGTYKCISCKMYRIEKFLESFKGLQENTLHLLPVLLGNDYIDSKLFNGFLKSINVRSNIKKQDKIQLVLDWLRNETPESAIQKILRTFKNLREKLFILNKIEKIVTSYYFTESKIFKYLNIESHNYKKYKKIDFKKLKEIIESDPDSIENGIIDSHPEKIDEESNPTEIVLENSTTDSKMSSETDHINSDECMSQENQLEDTENHELKLCVEENTPEKQIIEEATHTTEMNEVESEHLNVSSCSSVNNSGSPENGIENKAIQIDKEDIETKKSDSGDEEDEEKPQCNAFSFEETHLEKENTSENPISKQFQKNFTKCLYPSSFMDILTQNKYYCIPQVENYCEENSHIHSFNILCAIHKILTNDNSAVLTIVGRGEGTKVKWIPQGHYSIKVPSIEEIEQMPLQTRRETLFQILNIDNNFVTLLEHFPTEWHTFLIALKFAVSKTTFDTPLIYSLILDFIILNYIDQRIGFYRSSVRYKKKYYSYMQNLPPMHEHVPFRGDKNCFYYFPNIDCIVFMQKVIHLFTMNPKETSDTFDKHLLHQMAQIQSVLLHIKYLNCLLKNPYPNLLIHQIFDATFVYNLTKTFKEKSAELENNYLNVFFKDCPSILAGLKYALNMLNKQILL